MFDVPLRASSLLPSPRTFYASYSAYPSTLLVDTTSHGSTYVCIVNRCQTESHPPSQVRFSVRPHSCLSVRRRVMLYTVCWNPSRPSGHSITSYPFFHTPPHHHRLLFGTLFSPGMGTAESFLWPLWSATTRETARSRCWSRTRGSGWKRAR